MNLRTLTLSVAILAAACLGIWLLQRPAAPVVTDVRVGQSVLPADLAGRAAQVRITDNAKTVTLARQPDGTWRVSTYHDLPADFAKLSQLISNLTEAKVQRFVTSRPERLSRLEFKDTTLTLLDGDAKELWAVTLGKSSESGGRFLHYGKEEKGYEIAPNFVLEAESKNWADTALLTLKQDDITAVELGFVDGSFVAAKRATKEDPWSSDKAPAGKRLKAEKITSALSNLISLRFTDTTATDDAGIAAAKAHNQTIKLTTFGGETYTVALARKPEEKKLKPSDQGGGPASPPTATPAAGGADPGSSTTPAKPAEPEFETIPAGPVFAFISSSNDKAPINDLMKRRAFQIAEWTFTSLPANADDLWEDLPPPPAAPKKEAPKAGESPSPKSP